jgi:hypothetical protein
MKKSKKEKGIGIRFTEIKLASKTTLPHDPSYARADYILFLLRAATEKLEACLHAPNTRVVRQIINREEWIKDKEKTNG